VYWIPPKGRTSFPAIPPLLVDNGVQKASMAYDKPSGGRVWALGPFFYIQLRLPDLQNCFILSVRSFYNHSTPQNGLAEKFPRVFLDNLIGQGLVHLTHHFLGKGCAGKQDRG
jgi:hypothetical protein